MIFEIPVLKIELIAVKLILPYKFIRIAYNSIAAIIAVIVITTAFCRNHSAVLFSAAAAYLFFHTFGSLCRTGLHCPLTEIMSQSRYVFLFVAIALRTYIALKTALSTGRLPVILLYALPVMCCTVCDNHMAD